jgi:hypothetical protein
MKQARVHLRPKELKEDEACAIATLHPPGTTAVRTCVTFIELQELRIRLMFRSQTLN